MSDAEKNTDEKKINDPNPEGTAAALVQERAGLTRAAAAAPDDAKRKRYGDRIKQVDEQLKVRGYNSKGERVAGRQAPPQQTT